MCSRYWLVIFPADRKRTNRLPFHVSFFFAKAVEKPWIFEWAEASQNHGECCFRNDAVQLAGPRFDLFFICGSNILVADLFFQPGLCFWPKSFTDHGCGRSDYRDLDDPLAR